MNNVKKVLIVLSGAASIATSMYAQKKDTVRYLGNTLVNVDYHHGQLTPAVGVHNIQVFRANREHPEMAEGFGFTYNHQPMLAYWNNKFYLEYLSDRVGEHIPPGQTLLCNSQDGYTWTKPVVVFPQYNIPDGTTKEGYQGVAKNLKAVMHQRMGFYVSKKKRLMVLGFYGICLDKKDDPNDGNGIGRVIREVYADGSFGPIYFIRYNHLWNEKNTSYPFYKSSKDKGFVEVCDEILSSPLTTMQWVEEADRKDPIIPLHLDYKAFCYYHLNDGRVVGFWKNGLTTISNDNGKTWPDAASRAPGVVNGSAKMWGQRTSDGRFATVYNPSEFRWPLAISTSDDGLNYYNLWLLHGEISPMRYGGNEKSYGPQYIRGIIEGDGTPPGKDMWVSYSVNKEDIWIAKVAVPVKCEVKGAVDEDFNKMKAGEELNEWNIYSPLWAPVRIEKKGDDRMLMLKDEDRYEYAKAERVIEANKTGMIEFSLMAAQNNYGMMDIECQDAKGDVAIRMTLDSTGRLQVKAGAKYKNVMGYDANQVYNVKLVYNTSTRLYTVDVNGKQVLRALTFAPVDKIERVVFRTGSRRYFPTPDTPAEQTYDLLDAGTPETKAAIFYIKSFKAS
ncbi:six-hairpin glycosidase [Pinibacter soli]|uniref:Six-hairpin glycosidase n=1 Tax=Pinibacter soli TaxID=3044211 RepID=A0ABT6RF31_9BACT|nr:six-hairpin glycosidase [Pinibacter soli]MDI3321145.1 six-hairpin glycosidase [Pinibacter soli]